MAQQPITNILTARERRAPTLSLAVIWALGCTSVAVVGRFALDPFIGDALPYITFFGAVAVASWSAGWRSGTLCTVMSQLAAAYFFIPPRGSFNLSPGDWIGIAAFYLVSAMLVYPTERARRAIRERDEAVNQLQVESGNKNDFLALLAHELRGPVHTAKLAVHMANGLSVGEQRQREAHAMIVRQIEHVERLCGDLLDTAKIEQGKVSLVLQTVRTGDLLQQAVERSQSNIDKRGQRISVGCSVDAVQVTLDLGRMVQVISNLLDNASKYSPVGAVVRLEAAITGPDLSLKVVDTGIGFDAAQKLRLFESFFQVAPGSDGLGLGLPLVLRLVELHGGEVTASSPGLGMGATFTVYLPGAVVS